MVPAVKNIKQVMSLAHLTGNVPLEVVPFRIGNTSKLYDLRITGEQ